MIRSAPAKDKTLSEDQSTLPRPVNRTAEPVSKFGMNRPTRPSSSILPSVLKNLLPEKSGKERLPSSLMPRKPGLPPRWDASTPARGSPFRSLTRRGYEKGIRPDGSRLPPRVSGGRASLPSASVGSALASQSPVSGYIADNCQSFDRHQPQVLVRISSKVPFTRLRRLVDNCSPIAPTLAPDRQIKGHQVSQRWLAIHDQSIGTWRRKKARRTKDRYVPDPAVLIQSPHEQHRQAREKTPMLIGHGRPDCSADHVDIILRHFGARLNSAFTGMEHRKGLFENRHGVGSLT